MHYQTIQMLCVFHNLGYVFLQFFSFHTTSSMRTHIILLLFCLKLSTPKLLAPFLRMGTNLFKYYLKHVYYTMIFLLQHYGKTTTMVKLTFYYITSPFNETIR